MYQFPWLFHKKLHTSKVLHQSGEADWEIEGNVTAAISNVVSYKSPHSIIINYTANSVRKETSKGVQARQALICQISIHFSFSSPVKMK